MSKTKRMIHLSIGFTLIEVMIAMAVFAIAGTALLSSADASFSNLSRLENETVANWVASNQLVNASLATTWPPKNNKTGHVKMMGQQWFWQQTVLPTTDPHLRAVTVAVKLKADDQDILASITTYLADEQVP